MSSDEESAPLLFNFAVKLAEPSCLVLSIIMMHENRHIRAIQLCAALTILLLIWTGASYYCPKSNWSSSVLLSLPFTLPYLYIIIRPARANWTFGIAFVIALIALDTAKFFDASPFVIIPPRLHLSGRRWLWLSIAIVQAGIIVAVVGCLRSQLNREFYLMRGFLLATVYFFAYYFAVTFALGFDRYGPASYESTAVGELRAVYRCTQDGNLFIRTSQAQALSKCLQRASLSCNFLYNLYFQSRTGMIIARPMDATKLTRSFAIDQDGKVHYTTGNREPSLSDPAL